MNNEETIISQPQTSNSTEQKVANQSATVNNPSDVKDKKASGSAKRVAATAAAGAFGSVAGGLGAHAASHFMDVEEPEVEIEDEALDTADAPTHAATAQSAPVHGSKPATQDEEGNPDYTGQAGANPVTEQPQPTPTDNGDGNDSDEVQVLGVYQRTDENGVQQEMAILTNGEEVAAVVDTTGDGEVNVLAVDENHNGQFEEGEIYDVSNEHASMNMYEQAYVAQHPEMAEEQNILAAQEQQEIEQQEIEQQEIEQQEIEQQETFAYEATDDSDYNNEAPVYDA